MAYYPLMASSTAVLRASSAPLPPYHHLLLSSPLFTPPVPLQYLRLLLFSPLSQFQQEALKALSAAHWDVDGAIRHLKVERVFNLGLAPRDRCEMMLANCSWDVEVAGAALLGDAGGGGGDDDGDHLHGSRSNLESPTTTTSGGGRRQSYV